MRKGLISFGAVVLAGLLAFIAWSVFSTLTPKAAAMPSSAPSSTNAAAVPSEAQPLAVDASSGPTIAVLCGSWQRDSHTYILTFVYTDDKGVLVANASPDAAAGLNVKSTYELLLSIGADGHVTLYRATYDYHVVPNIC